MKIQRLLLSVLLGALIMALTLACVKTKETALAAPTTFIFAIESDPGNDINTITTSSRYDLSLERMLYSPLYDYFGPNDITYLLAERIQVSDDQQTLTVWLRKGVRWSDGTPFTADDVIFTYEHIIKTEYANGHEGFVFNGKPVTLSKLDEYTVEFRYPVFAGNLLESVVAEHFIMPKHIYDGDERLDNNPKNKQPVGTGPYTLAGYIAGSVINLDANEYYFLGKPKIPHIVLQIVSDMNAAKLALQLGEIHALVLSNADAETFDTTNVTIHAYPEDRVGYLAFNFVSSRVHDLNLRKAVFFALDREEMNIGAYLSPDFFVNAYSFLPYSSTYSTGDLERYNHNLARSKELLAKVPNVPSLRLAYAANNVQQEIQAMIAQQNLKAAGISLELVATEAVSLFNRLRDGAGDIDLYLGGYIMGIDPSNYASLFVSGSVSNYGHLADTSLDALFAAGSVERDLAQRLRIYQDTQRRLADIAAQYPIVTNKRLLGVNKRIGGIDEARLIPIYTFEDMSKLYFK